MAKQFDVFMLEAPDILAIHWAWSIALGVTIAILGVAAIWKANTATALYVRFLGVLGLLGALAVFSFSFTLAGFWTEFFVHVLWACVLGAVGAIMLFKPNAGADAITLMPAVYFLVSGFLTIGFALSAHVDNLAIYLGEGAINVVLGLICLSGGQLPDCGLLDLHRRGSFAEGLCDRRNGPKPARDLRGVSIYTFL